MEKTVVFTVSKSGATGGKKYNLTSKAFNLYNKLEVPEQQLFEAMAELTDTFNNVLGFAILFEIDQEVI